jgi:hypothetical protein
MAAFPEGSANNTLGGSGPVNKSLNLDQIHGKGAEGFTDYNMSGSSSRRQPLRYEAYAGASAPIRDGARSGMPGFDPSAKTDMVHGDETMGLGTSTFLEGAPAPRVAIQRRESETDAMNEGLSRRKSLAQRIRGISNSRPTGVRERHRPAVASPEPRNDKVTTPDEAPGAGGIKAAREASQNPSSQDYDDAYEKKGASIRIAQEQNDGATGESAPSSPSAGVQMGLERTATEGSLPHAANEGSANPEERPPPSGFLSRVKSMRSKKDKPRSDKKE